MSTPHPMWSAIKRGMLLGGIVGLNLSFFFVADWYANWSSLGDIFGYMIAGAAAGTFVGAALGMAWRRLQGPLSRLETDLKAAAVLRDKGLINDFDFQSLKARILATYEPDPGGARTVLTVMGWMCLFGITASLGKMVGDFSVWTSFPINDTITTLILPLAAAGVAAGAVTAAIIQSALEKGSAPGRGRTPSASTPSMLGVGGFDPLGSIRETEAAAAAKATKGR